MYQQIYKSAVKRIKRALNEINSPYYQSVLDIDKKIGNITCNNGRDAIVKDKNRNLFMIGYSCRFPAYRLVYDKYRRTSVLDLYTMYDERILHLDYGSFDNKEDITSEEFYEIVNRYNVSDLMFTNYDLSGYEISPYDYFEDKRVADKFQTYIDYLRRIDL